MTISFRRPVFEVRRICINCYETGEGEDRDNDDESQPQCSADQ